VSASRLKLGITHPYPNLPIHGRRSPPVSPQSVAVGLGDGTLGRERALGQPFPSRGVGGSHVAPRYRPNPARRFGRLGGLPHRLIVEYVERAVRPLVWPSVDEHSRILACLSFPIRFSAQPD
jgi:hypothetical protein